MPIYNSYITNSRMPFRRLGYHMRSTKTHSTTNVTDLEVGTLPSRPASKRSKFSPRTSFDFSAPAAIIPEASAIFMKIESPPLVFYGPPRESSGALLSGLIHLRNDSGQEWKSFTMSLQKKVLTKRPVYGGCPECANSVEVINQWTFISTPTKKNVSTYPFSFLLPGNLPAANNNSLTKISYSLVATAISPDGSELHFTKAITVERSILPGPDRNSVRIFPPTKLSAAVKLPSVVHPGGDFVFDIRLDGIVSREKNTRWRLRKANWRIDENTRAMSPACPHHRCKLGAGESGVFHEDTRLVGFGEIKRGWKTDFDTADGRIELEVLAGIPLIHNAACNLDASGPDGSRVEHILIVEMIVAEETKPVGINKIVTPTGAARVLRMQFKLVVTGRSGLGISWDEEAPPVYDDVPASPPAYGVPSHTLSYADFPPAEDLFAALSIN